MRRWLLLTLLLAPSFAPAQDIPPEISELRRRVVAIRGSLPAVTETAEYLARVFGADSTRRFLVSRQFDPATWMEWYWRAGGPPETGNADDPAARGVVILPIRAWDQGLAAAMLAERYLGQGRPVVTIGSAAERPTLRVGQRVLDNGAPDGSRSYAAINGIANIIVGWTLYAEFVAAATREGWQPGSYLSVMAPGAEGYNGGVHFRMFSAPEPPRVAAGVLGAAYLDAIDSILVADAAAAHQALVRRSVDSLRARRARGGQLLVATCGHYLSDELPRDSIGSPFRHVEWRWDIAGKLREREARPGDAMLWFGYAKYDCPNVEVADVFQQAGLGVVILSRELAPSRPNVMVHLPMHFAPLDASVKVPFPPGDIGATASVELALHYLWIKRLVATP